MEDGGWRMKKRKDSGEVVGYKYAPKPIYPVQFVGIGVKSEER